MGDGGSPTRLWRRPICGGRAAAATLTRVGAAARRSVLGEWDDLEAYLPKVNAPGSRAPSYRAASPAGHTCVHFLGLPAAAPELAAELASFREAVDAALPGLYEWLDEASLHVTVRSLDAVVDAD